MAIKTHSSPYYPYIFFGAVALAVLLPLLAPGFVLTLDMVFTPHIHLPGQVSSSYLFYALLHVLNTVIPADILQKIILASIVFLSGIGGYKLVEQTTEPGGQARIGAYVSGMLYAVNPYTYSRFMAGQFAVLLGYCLLPFVAIQLLALAKHPTWRRSVGLGLLLTIVGIVSIHTLGPVAILLIASACTTGWQYRHQLQQLKYYAVNLALVLGSLIILSAYWLVPTVTGSNTTASAIAGFTSGDEQAFATLGNGFFGQLIHILRLQGFWAENSHTFVLPQTVLPGWWLGVCLLWVLVGLGVAAVWRGKQRQLVAIFAFSAIIGTVLATGGLNPLLDTTVPLFRGFREPHKFTCLVALAYALFAGWGVKFALDYLSGRRFAVLYQVMLAAVLLLPIVLTPTMFWGFGGQLRPVQYPATWVTINSRLNNDKAPFQILFLPWHLYMYYRFADRIIVNPAPNYFDKPVISSNNPEFGNASTDKPDARKTLLSNQILPAAAAGTNIGQQLAALHIKYVLLDKDNDFQRYSYLDHQADLRLVSENANLKLYLNTAFGG